MSQTLTKIRAKYPQYGNIPDAELAHTIRRKFPVYAEQDPELAREAEAFVPDALQPVNPSANVSPAEIQAATPGEDMSSPRYVERPADFYLTDAQREAKQADYLASLEDNGPMGITFKGIRLPARGGKVLLAGAADLASAYPGGVAPSTENLRAYAQNPGGQLPIEEALADTHGISSIPGKAAAGTLKVAPMLATGAGLSALGAPSWAASTLSVMSDEQGNMDPVGMAIAAGIPGAHGIGEKAVAKGLSMLPTQRVVVEVLSKDPLKLKGKVVQQLGGLQISNDVFRKYLETGGGITAVNAYLAAANTPQILALPKEQREGAVMDLVANNLALSLLGVSTRKGTSLTLEKMLPELRAEWLKANGGRPSPGAAAPELSGGPVAPATPRPAAAGDGRPPAPVPEPPATIEAQVAATVDPNTPKAVTLVTPGAQVPPDTKNLVPVPTQAGTALVNPDKVDPAEAQTTLNAGGGGQLLGMSTDQKPVGPASPSGPPVLQTKTAAGDVVQEEVVTPATLPAAIKAGEAVAPGGTQEVKPAKQVISERLDDPPVPHPGSNISNMVARRLRAGETVTSAQVRDEGLSFGLDDRQSGEWAELGATWVAGEIAQDTTMGNADKYAALVSLYNRMPTNGVRTVETKVNQQYSTPPPLAFIAGLLADVPNGTGFVDPTAGHGMLGITVSPSVRMALNELDPQRVQRLLGAPAPLTYISHFDALSPEFLKQLRETKPDRLGLNPPFGSVLNAEGTGNKQFPIANPVVPAVKTTPSIDLAIALNSLDAMDPNGKAFVIIGAKTGTPMVAMFGTDKQRAEAYRRPVMMEFFEKYNVVDWFTIGPDLFRKMGTDAPVDVIIIHGRGKTKSAKDGGLVRPWVTPPRLIESWEELGKLIPSNETQSRPSAGETGGSPGGARPSTPAARPASGQGGSALPAERPQRPAGGSRPGGGDSSAPPAASPNPTPAAPAVSPGDSGAGIGQGTPATPGQVADGGAQGGKPGTPAVGGTRPVAAGSGPDKPKQPKLAPGSPLPAPKPSVPAEGLPASLMVPFQSASKGASLKLVAPRNIANQMLTAARQLEQEVGMPIDEYVAGKLGRDVKTLLSQLAGAQVDTAALAIRNIERGSALICAHETGVGKGRVVAALIEYARLQGRIPIFVTAKPNLYEDMVARDLPALGNKDFKPFITNTTFTYEDAHGREVKSKGSAASRVAEMEQILRTGNLPGGAQGVFTTYDQLKGDKPAGWKETPKEKFKRKGGRDGKNATPRPDGPRFAMLRALAPRAIFILDEAHLAAGPGSEVNMSLSTILPQAGGIYYSSATFAKRPDNLGLYAIGTLMKRTGLDNQAMTEALQKGGVPLQQALTSMLAESGELIRAQQDWTGVPMSFKSTATDAAAVAREVQAADTYTSFIRDLILLQKIVNKAGKGLEDGENQVRADEEQVRLQDINPMARLFNLSNQYLFALRADAVATEAVTELKAGRKPFIHVHNTLEGPLMDLRARKLPMNFQGILLREMQKMLVLTVRDPQAEGGKRQVELSPEDLPDGGEFYRRMEKQILATDLSEFPISPIDHIKKKIQAAGYSMGEITARDGEVDDTGDEVTITKREKAARNKILKNYNDGAIDVLLINGSGGTGLSAHTDPRFKDQRQRSYIEGQPAPDINEEMQAMGRTMRSGQTSKPKYTFPSTALAAERRFATMLRGKMTSLNANTTAEGESGLTQQEGFADDIFNKVGDEVVFRVMQANEDLANLMDLGTGADDGELLDGFARQATGRFVLLPNADAQRLWDEIIAEYKDEIQQLDEQGQNPLRATAEDLRARTLSAQELVAASGDTLFDGPAVLEKAMVKPPKAPPTHAEAVQRAKDNLPTIKQRVREWLDKSKAAEAERVAVAEQRGQTDDQIGRIRATMENVRLHVVEAASMVGDSFGVDMLGDGSISYYGVAAEFKLADKSLSDFASASRQQVVLTTNTFRGRLTLPLSKVFKGDANPLLQPLDEEAAAEQFDATAENNAERYIVTGNLLRGWEAADAATSGAEGGRPRVAIYTREDGSLATGILMPPAWTPGEAAKPQQVIQDPAQFVMFLHNQTPMRSLPTSSVHPVQVVAGRLSVPSSGQGKLLWGDPAFGQFFEQSPQQVQGNFVAFIKPALATQLHGWLTGKGVRLIVKPSESAAMSSGGGSSARGAFVSGASKAPGSVPPTVTYGGMKFVRPLELPELVRLARELSGEVPKLRKFPRRGSKQTLGQFGDGMITLDPRIFKDSATAGAVLAHELGHLVDYLPHETLKRGNLLGHLLALRSFLKGNFGGLNNKELRTELLAVTMWWRPYDPLVDPPSYVKYRESAEELYADALSVLFNAPAELEQRAPKFYAAFWEKLSSRPDAETALFAIQDMLNKGKLASAADREARLEAGFAEGENRWRAAVAAREAAAKSWDGWWTRLAQELYWNFYPLEQRAARVEKLGGTLDPAKDPRVFLDDLGFKDVTVMRWGRLIHERVVQPIEAAGLTLEDAGKMLFYRRILEGDRSGLANSGGIDVDAARLGLLKMNLELGLGKMTLLRSALDRFHAEVFKLSEQAVAVGAYNKGTFERVIKPNKGTYATFAVLDYVDDWIPPGIKEQIGTLKDVANPFHATILKSIGLINLIAYQQAKNKTLDFLRSYYAGDIVQAPGDGRPATRKGKGIFMRLENGKPVHYYTDPYIADAFDKLNPRILWPVIRAADGIFRKFIYPLIITYNPAFLYIMSPLRDMQRTARNLPGVRLSVGGLPVEQARLLVQTGQRYMGQRAYESATGRKYVGQGSPLIREMEANLALGTPFDQFVRGHRDDFLADLLQKMRVLPDREMQGWFKNVVWLPVRGALDKMELGGLTLDSVAKTAAYSMLRKKGYTPREAGAWVRNNAGLPNINKKGLLVRQMRALVPFWNVFTQGWRADVKLMSSPNTAGGWWLRYMMSNGLVRALLAAAAAGALGAALKELFDGISEYDKTNYISVPVGEVEGGDFGRKTAYLRIPESETDRVIGGLISKTIRSLGPDSPELSGILDFGMGQIPAVNPALTVPEKWVEFVAGQNPRDPFRGRDIIPQREWTAGGLDAVKPMTAWTVEQTGAMNFFRWDPRSDTTWELALSTVPGINKFVKVSDQGLREQQRKQQDEQQALAARARLQLPDKVQSIELEYWRLARLDDKRTPEQERRYVDLHVWYRNVYSPAWEQIQRATEEQRGGEAQRLREGLDRDSRSYYRR